MTKFNLDVKKKFIELMESNKYSIQAATKELGVSKKLGNRWWKLYQIHGYAGLSMSSGEYTGEFKIHVVKYTHK